MLIIIKATYLNYTGFPLTEISKLVEWLKENDEPESEVKVTWKSTFDEREKCDNILFYFDTYKCLSRISVTL